MQFNASFYEFQSENAELIQSIYSISDIILNNM